MEAAEKSGEGWTEKQDQPLRTLHQLAHDYAASAERAGAPAKTVRFRDGMIGAWLDFLGGREATDPPAGRPHRADFGPADHRQRCMSDARKIDCVGYSAGRGIQARTGFGPVGQSRLVALRQDDGPLRLVTDLDPGEELTAAPGLPACGSRPGKRFNGGSPPACLWGDVPPI